MSTIIAPGNLIDYIQRERKIQSPGHHYPEVSSRSSSAQSSSASTKEQEDQEKPSHFSWTSAKTLEKDTEKTGEEFSFESSLVTLMTLLEKSRANSRTSTENKTKVETGKVESGDS